MDKKQYSITIGVLTSKMVDTTAEVDVIREAGQTAADLLSGGSRNMKIKDICADVLSGSELKDVDILVNTLGQYYPEEGWSHIKSYYYKGGTILNIGLKPFTIPYVIDGEKAEILDETALALHSIEVIDDFVLTGPSHEGMKVEVMNSRYSFIKKMYDEDRFPSMKETCSFYYRLAENTIKKDPMGLDSVNVPDSQMEIACGWVDNGGRLLSVPISRIDHFSRGSLVFLDFTPDDPHFYRCDSGKELLAYILKTCMTDTVCMEAYGEYARYYENEDPRIILKVTRLHESRLNIPGYSMKITVSDLDKNVKAREITISDISLMNGYFETALPIGNLEEGFYGVNVQLFAGCEIISEKNTGFYKISRDNSWRILEQFKNITFDASKSPDFFLQDGKPYVLHGTNYHVTDAYRDCFVRFNPWQCEKDLLQLKHGGINVLRTGNWQSHMEFFNDKGFINERALRALEALFLTSARHGMLVQFVLGGFAFNPWDRSKCPIHNPSMRQKTMNAFASFAERFKGWPNVQLDAMNEPSYSYPGLWHLALPSGDEYERKNWSEWLRKKYCGDIKNLRRAWGAGSHSISSFENAPLPDRSTYRRLYNAKMTSYPMYPSLTDFFAFARESFTGWVSDLKYEVKSRASDMVFMMGRDESIRVPAEQDEVRRGNIEMVNWHHWHSDTIVFAEYFFNRVRGLPCCGQEVGAYHTASQRGDMWLTEKECSRVVERKILYSFGNWLQWQAYCDPFMVSQREICLGMMRSDRTETPYMDFARLLSWAEENTRGYMLSRDEDAMDILTVHPTYSYFSVDNKLVYRGMVHSVLALHYHLKGQSDFILEDHLEEEITRESGDPKLIIFPAVLMTSDRTWDVLLKYVKRGKTVLISGNVNVNEYWKHADRLHEIGIKAHMEKLSPVEDIRIGDKLYTVSFREGTEYKNPSNAFCKFVFDGKEKNTVQVFKIGQGKLVFSPIPVEFGDEIEPVAALYEYAMEQANIQDSIFTMGEKGRRNTLVYPIPYKECTVYTIVNEGTEETVGFTDLSSGKNVEVTVKEQRGSKIWLSRTGRLIGAYINGKLKIDDMEIIPNGDLSLYQEDYKFKWIAGSREKPYITVNGENIDVSDDMLFIEQTTC